MNQPLPTPPTPLNALSWQQKMEFAQKLALYPALTVLVVLRRRIGLRQLKPSRLFGMAAFLIVLGNICSHLPPLPIGIGIGPRGELPGPDGFGGAVLILYALGLLGWGLFQRRQRRVELGAGMRWHTWTTGISRFEFLPVSRYIVHRFVDPLVCILAGTVISVFSQPLGLWLMVSGCALALHEQAIYEKMLERELDTLDGLLESEVHAETVEQFSSDGSGAAAMETSLTLEQTAGIPTGIAPDIQRQIAQRLKREPLSARAEHSHSDTESRAA